MSQSKKETKKEPNDIRIGMNSRPRNVIKYATSVMDEKKLTELKFSAVGGSIGRLLDIVEVFKVLKPGLYQQNRITSVAYQTVDSNNELLQQRLFPKLEVILSKEEPKTKTEGFQGQMDEKQRKEIETIMNKKKEQREKIEEEEDQEEEVEVDLEVEEEEPDSEEEEEASEDQEEEEVPLEELIIEEEELTEEPMLEGEEANKEELTLHQEEIEEEDLNKFKYIIVE